MLNSIIPLRLLTSALFAVSVLAQLDPIVIKGSKFFYKTNGTEFFARGIAYQQEASSLVNGTGGSISSSGSSTYKDPLADAQRCAIDIPLMAAIRTNLIRVYAIDPTLDHTACMNLLEQYGIYVFADLSEPGLSINRNDPQWNYELYNRYTSVIDFFSQYTNAIGFFAGNEVTNSLNTTSASAFVKAAVRDMKAYIVAKNYRQMYVGYATSDDMDVRANMAAYFNCGDQSSAIDFWGYNIYEFCGNATYESSGYADRVAEFKGYSVPSFFAEYGCNQPAPRVFAEVPVLFGPQMTPTFSGGIVYQWFQDVNNYGLVDISSGTVSPYPDYTNLGIQMDSVNPSGVAASSYNPSNTPASCPSVVTGTWESKATALPPTPDEGLCSCMYNSLKCVVKSTVQSSAYANLFSTVCGFGGGSSCAGIRTSPITGQYGAYSMCNSTEQLSFAFNQYYLSQNSQASACSYDGAAGLKQAVTPSGSCAAAISQIGSSGTGTASAPGSSTTKENDAVIQRSSLQPLLFIYVLLAGAFGAGLIFV